MLFNYEKDILLEAGFSRKEIEEFEKSFNNKIIFKFLVKNLMRERKNEFVIENDNERDRKYGAMEFIKEFPLEFNAIYIDLDKWLDETSDIDLEKIEEYLDIDLLREIAKQNLGKIIKGNKNLVIFDNFNVEHWFIHFRRDFKLFAGILYEFLNDLREKNIKIVIMKERFGDGSISQRFFKKFIPQGAIVKV